MRIVCLGGGPAGLYFAISMKIRDASHDITVIERNRPYDTFGWGVVFSDETMDGLAENDPQTAEEILGALARWDDVEVRFAGEVHRSGGHGFCGIGRKHLLNILQKRCEDLGIKLVFEQEIDIADVERYKTEADLVVASDGLNSKIRTHWADHFKPEIEVRPNKFIWLGTKQTFEAFTFAFKELPEGWIWSHCYKFDQDTATFIVECSDETYDKLGFEHMSQEENVRALEKIFADDLGGHELLSNSAHIRGSAWINFPRILCEQWSMDNLVLMGDAVHTAHFSIGSGTKLAFEDAIFLAEALHETGSMEKAFQDYQETRRIDCLRLQSAARNSMEWFEYLDRYVNFDPVQFTYALLTRSQRVSHENLRLRDQAWLEDIEDWFATKAAGQRPQQKTPPMFTPFKLREMELSNRVVVSPMCMYSSDQGMPDDFHLVHYGSRAQGGAGLIYTEMTAISETARITPGCAGIYNDEHTAAWKRVVDFVHGSTGAKFAIQLGHAGPKGSTKLLWDGMDEPLEQGNWDLLAASPVPWADGNQVPRAMTRDDMDQVIADYVAAAKRADDAGFDMIEIHNAHGYLLSAFITPLTNKREDEYGGSLENRLRYPLEVFEAIRAVWPDHKPISVRISATDWVANGGVDGAEAIEIARAFKEAGVDIINVSAGQTSTEANPIYGRMFQTPYSDAIRNTVGIPTLAVGNIYEIDHVNSIIMSGRADLCCMARPHLADPYWTLHAAAQQDYDGARWPVQYESGKTQYVTNLKRAAEMAINA